LDGYFLADVKNKFKEQKVYIDLYVPKNQTIYLDKSTRTFLYNVDNTQNIYDRDMAKHYFKMIDNGLTCLDCEDYKFRNNDDSDAFNLKIDENGVHMEAKDENNEKVEVKIDKNGLVITTTEDSI
ncbi:MAG: hypothetical protein KAT78_04800, partial [Flavobacteriaceae bacterium]|nr:hypothetical protein [Flavobacteriaceae bacterium]